MTGGQKSYNTLISDHAEATKHFLKLRVIDSILYTVIFSVFALLMRTKVEHFYLFATILFGILLALRVRFFVFARTHDQKMAQRILEGIKLEKNHLHLDNFFHKYLKRFSLSGVILVIARRGLADLLALLFFVRMLQHFIPDAYSSLLFSLKPILLILGYFVGDLYYRPLAPLMHTQKEVFAN